MKKKYLRLSMLAVAWILGTSVFAQHEHTYRNGICTHPDCVRGQEGYFEEPTQAEDGFYELRNAGNVEWLSWMVSMARLDVDARLMNDIDFEGIENLHEPIGPTNGKKYNATFDGQGFRIKNMIINRPDSERQGFFGALRGNPNTRGEATIIKNLIIDSSCHIIGGKRTAGIAAAGQNYEMPIYIQNCVNEATIESPTNNVGGILGGSDSSHPKWKISNCVNAGTIISTADSPEASAIASWCGDNAETVIENCINIGEVIGMDGSSRNMWRHSGSLKAINNYDFSANQEGTQGFDHNFEMDDLTNGKLCYMLNGDQSVITWYQTLGVDAYPLPVPVSKQVYSQGTFLCDGTPLDAVYTNDPSVAVIPDHEYDGDDYHCVNCGTINPDYCEKVDGVYQVSTPKQMNWFAEMVNSGVAGRDTMHVALTADLDYNELDEEIVFIGRQATPYKGYFDGQFHKVSNYVVNTDESQVGLFGYINGGATIKNLVMDETCELYGSNGVGLIAFCSTAGNVLLENLGFEGTAIASVSGAGGILGCNTGSSAKIYMRNCYVTGHIAGLGKNENGLLSAWLGSNNPVVENCWASGFVEGYENEGKSLARHTGGTFTNCYATSGTQVSLITDEDVESGALCYMINGDQSNLIWYQNLDKGTADLHPTFIPSHAIVYANAPKKCDGSFNPEDVQYSNFDTSDVPAHEYVDGFCKNCGHEDEDYPFIRIFANADHNTAGGYTNVQSNDGSGLAINNSVAEHWNQRYFTSWQELTGLEPGTYKLRVQGYSRIAAWDQKDAEGERIYDAGDGTPNEELFALHHNSVYYVEKNGKQIANRFMPITDGAQEQSITSALESTTDDESLFVPNSLAAARVYFEKGNYWNAPLYFSVESEDDVINVGVHNNMYIYGNWTVWDTWRLEKVDTDAAEAIRAQQVAALQDLSMMDAQASLVEAYNEARTAIKTAASLSEVETLADVLSRTPEQIRLSHEAYIKYDAAVKAVIAEREGKDLNGVYAEMLDTYLEESEEASEALPNGTYDYIMTHKPLSVEELEAEILFIQQLYMTAVKNSISAGADLTALIVNPGFDMDSNWTGWNRKEIKSGSSSNISCNTGFTDIYPVAGSWNKAFDVWQDMEEGLPNGIYELSAPAFHRPGGEGFNGGVIEDMSNAELYINDFYTPVLNVWEGEISYADAIDGVNVRLEEGLYNPDIPHNGEQLASYSFDTGTGYIPGSGRYELSFIFAGGRYVNKAYAVVNDGKLRIGIRNTGEPWYESQETMWGRFQLTYMGTTSEEAQQAMLASFEKRLTKMKYAQEIGTADGEYFLMSCSHFDNIQSLIDKAQSLSGAEQLAVLEELNAAFNATYTSHTIYMRLKSLIDYCFDKSMELYETDPDMADLFDAASMEIEAIVYDGSLTDEEADAYYNDFMMREDLGGGYYVQGDLVDAEGNNLTYGNTNYYKMTKNAQGKYTATVTTQNRANQPNANGRAGLYISCLGINYKATSGAHRYVTPAHNTYTLVAGAGNDLQMTGGTFDITFDPETGDITLDVVDYKWADRVFIVGSVTNRDGQFGSSVRWQNNEMNGLRHQGNGLYAGTVDFFEDPKHPGYMAFTLFTTRATDGKEEYTYGSARSGWNEGRVGNDYYNGVAVASELIIQEGEVYDNLARGLDRQWWLAWDNESDTQTYTIVYDMNENTMKIAKGDLMSSIDRVLSGELAIDGVYTISGVRLQKAQRGVNIVNGRKVLVK